MAVKLPSGDLLSAPSDPAFGWHDQVGQRTGLYANLRDPSTANYVTTDALGPRGITAFITFTDDEGIGEGNSTLIDGFRRGERACEDLFSLQARATMLPWFFCTRGLCMPSRAEAISGLMRPNNGCENAASYRTQYYMQGVLNTRDMGGATQFSGPWYKDLGLQALLAETGVPTAQQPLGTTTSGKRTIPTYSAGSTYAHYALVDDGAGQKYISQQDANHGNALSNTSWWLPTEARAGRGNSSAAIDDLQYTSGSIFTALPDHMTQRDVDDGRVEIRKAWVGKGDTYDGATGSGALSASEDPLYGLYDSAASYALGAGVHDGYFFYTSAQNANMGHAPSLGGSNSWWTLVNPPLTTRFVPAGLHFYAILIGDGLGSTGALVDYYHNEYIVYDAAEPLRPPNPRDGDGVIGDTYAFDYDWPISSISWDATNSRALVTLTSAAGYYLNGVFVAEPPQVGDEVAIAGTTVSGRTDSCTVHGGSVTVDDPSILASDVGREVVSSHIGTGTTILTVTPGVGFTMSAAASGSGAFAGEAVAFRAYEGRGWIVDQAVSSTQFYVKHDVLGNPVLNGGTWVTGGAFAYLRKYYTAQLDKRFIHRFLDSVALSEHSLIWYCPRMPHAEVGDSGGTVLGDPEFELERRYWLTVDPATSTMFGGVPGAYSPANLNDPNASGSHQKTWRSRDELLASFNDVLCRDSDALMPRLEARGRLKWIRWADNGWQQGAREATESSDVWSRVDGKDMAWPESCNVPCFIMDPDNANLPAGQILWNTGPFCPADIGGTVLDIFDPIDPSGILGDHVWHARKDGQSIYRWLAASDGDAIRNRLLPFQGKYLQGVWSGTSPTSQHGGLGVTDKNIRQLTVRFDDYVTGSLGSWQRVALPPPSWDSSTSFAKWSVVQRLGVRYISLAASNTNHAPESSPSWWQPTGYAVTFNPAAPNLVSGSVGAWDGATTDLAAALKTMFDSGRWNGSANTIRAAYSGR